MPKNRGLQCFRMWRFGLPFTKSFRIVSGPSVKLEGGHGPLVHEQRGVWHVGRHQHARGGVSELLGPQGWGEIHLPKVSGVFFKSGFRGLGFEGVCFYQEIRGSCTHPPPSFLGSSGAMQGSSAGAELRHLPLEEIRSRCPEEVEDSRMYAPALHMLGCCPHLRPP